MIAKIIGTGCYVPDRVITNDDLAKIVETSDEWIKTRTGILQRRILDGSTEQERRQGTAAMASEAARKAMENVGVAPDEIDIIVVATSTPDCCFPSTACEVQADIGAVHAVAYDLSAACSGFIFALSNVQAYISAGIYKTALVIGVDNLSKIVNWKDRSTCVLFGDGAGAAMVKAVHESEGGILHMNVGSDGSRGEVLSCVSRTMANFLTDSSPEPGYLSMDGQEVFKFAVKKVPECVEQLLRDSDTEIEEIKYLILHQANYRICESISRRLKISMEKVPTNIERFGNTSAASIPILLDEWNRNGKLAAGDKIVLAGFGAGLTWGAILICW